MSIGVLLQHNYAPHKTYSHPLKVEVLKENVIDIRLFILQEYQQGIFGYKKLAKKYGLTKDQVRTIVNSKNISLTKNQEEIYASAKV